MGSTYGFLFAGARPNLSSEHIDTEIPGFPEWKTVKKQGDIYQVYPDSQTNEKILNNLR